jgi:hypothetical protein
VLDGAGTTGLVGAAVSVVLLAGALLALFAWVWPEFRRW